MWRQVVAQSPGENAPAAEVLRYDVGWKALNTMLKSGRSLSGHERNCCFLNTKGQRFANISAAASLDFDDDGRVLAVSDWDCDGDLDFWIANRTGPQLRFMRNDVTNDHNYVAFKLEGVQCNRDAIGARVELQLATSDHPIRTKTLRAGEGYLAQSSKWVTFGLGKDKTIERAIIHWPDGSNETISGLEPNRRYQVRQGSGKAEPWTTPSRAVALAPSKVVTPKATDQSRIVLISPIPLPATAYETFDNESKSLDTASTPRLINFWATWCQPCVEELTEWNAHAEQLAASGIEVVAVNVDEPETDAARRSEQKDRAKQLFDKLALSFEGGFGTESLVRQFDVLQRAILRRQKPMPVPTSFLVDARGNLRVIYKGPVHTEQILADAKLLNASPEEIVAASTPYAGKWLGQPGGSSPNQVAIRFLEGGHTKEAESYLRKLATAGRANPMYNPAEAMLLLGAICADQRRFDEAVEAYQAAISANPDHRQAHIELANVLTKLNRDQEATVHYLAALKNRPNDPELRFKLGLALQESGQHRDAIGEFRTAISLRPSAVAHHHLANSLLAVGEEVDAISNYERAISIEPKFGAAANNLAWLMSTHTAVLNPERAVEVAKNMVANSSPNTTSGELDTLAAAFAAAGSFDEAIQTAERAMRLAESGSDTAKAKRIAKRIESYQQQTPFVEQ